MNLDDQLFQMMKKIPKMAPKIEPVPVAKEEETGWDDFQGGSEQTAPVVGKDRYDLISEAFEELLQEANPK